MKTLVIIKIVLLIQLLILVLIFLCYIIIGAEKTNKLIYEKLIPWLLGTTIILLIIGLFIIHNMEMKETDTDKLIIDLTSQLTKIEDSQRILQRAIEMLTSDSRQPTWIIELQEKYPQFAKQMNKIKDILTSPPVRFAETLIKTYWYGTNTYIYWYTPTRTLARGFVDNIIIPTTDTVMAQTDDETLKLVAKIGTPIFCVVSLIGVSYTVYMVAQAIIVFIV